MDNIQAYLDKLGIDKEGYWSEDRSTYIIPLADSDEFARVYTKLDNADWLLLYDGELSLREESSSLLFLNDDINFTLKSDFINNNYSLEVREEQ